MRQFSYSILDYRKISDSLEDFIRKCPDTYSALVVSIYTCCTEDAEINFMIETVKSRLPRAIIAGSTTSGEIYEGESRLRSTMLRLRVFEHATAQLQTVNVAESTPERAGAILTANCLAMDELVGIEALCTVKNFNAYPFLAQLSQLPEEVRVFGGGADTYAIDGISRVFSNDGIIVKGVVAVCYCGKELSIDLHAVWGWKPLGRKFHITGMDGATIISTFDKQPAVDIYGRYLRIQPSGWFSEKAIEFPVMVERNGKALARVPITYTEDGSLLFAADFKPEEEVRLSYGDPMEIIMQCNRSCTALRTFQPEALQLFSCVTRRKFLHENVNLELGAYQNVAPTSGFYTYGEILRIGKDVDILNVTSVLAGFREKALSVGASCPLPQPDEEIDSKLSTIQRLAHFIAMISGELEEVNHKLDVLARQDRLTELCNRGEIEANLQSEIATIGSGKPKLAIIMLDLDHFKHINDTYGHDIGDKVLKAVAQTLRENTRFLDGCGRWGGEEFLIILPNTDQDIALNIAERIRKRLEALDILPDGAPITASFGVAAYHIGESYQDFYRRLDSALYEAKESGRNHVVLAGEVSTPAGDQAGEAKPRESTTPENVAKNIHIGGYF